MPLMILEASKNCHYAWTRRRFLALDYSLQKATFCLALYLCNIIAVKKVVKRRPADRISDVFALHLYWSVAVHWFPCFVRFLNVCMCRKGGPFKCLELDTFDSLMSVAVLCLILKLLGKKTSSLGVAGRTSEGYWHWVSVWQVVWTWPKI